MEYYVILCDWIKHYQFYKISEVNRVSTLNLYNFCLVKLIHAKEKENISKRK